MVAAMEKPNLYLVRAADVAAHAQEFSHPWNPDSLVRGTQLARSVGLKRTGVNFLSVPPGKESYVYHSHCFEEEWLYVLAGAGIALIDGVEYRVGPGDFMGFPTPSVAHLMRNPGPGDLVYLSGAKPRVRSGGIPDVAQARGAHWVSRWISTTWTTRRRSARYEGVKDERIEPAADAIDSTILSVMRARFSQTSHSSRNTPPSQAA
jgi:uncharacterized cupin superfamily protein